MTRVQITFTNGCTLKEVGCTIAMVVHINIELIALNCCWTSLHSLNWTPLCNGICPADVFRTLWRLGGLWRHCYHCWVNAIQRWSKWSGENHCIQQPVLSFLQYHAYWTFSTTTVFPWFRQKCCSSECQSLCQSRQHCEWQHSLSTLMLSLPLKRWFRDVMWLEQLKSSSMYC